MSTTRAAILRRALSLVPTVAFATNDGVNALTVTGGSASTVIDTANQLPAGFAVATHKNWELVRPAMLSGTAGQKAADKVRVVSSYAPSTNTWTVGAPTYAITPASTERYLVVKDPINIWETALNEALATECFLIRFNSWTPTSNTQRIYTLGTAPLNLITDLEREADIHNIQFHPLSDATDAEQWQDWYNGRDRLWRAFEDAGVLYIDFGGATYGGTRPGTTNVMRLVVTRPYPTLTDETTSSAVDAEWAAYATIMVMCRQLADMNDPRNEWTRIYHNLKPAEFVRKRRSAELGKYAFRTVDRTSQRVGGARVGGRGGR